MREFPTCTECGTEVEEEGRLCEECNAVYERQEDERQRLEEVER
jgi:tRNA(Ile2) C34 agmatinyltransferase TiaS